MIKYLAWSVLEVAVLGAAIRDRISSRRAQTALRRDNLGWMR